MHYLIVFVFGIGYSRIADEHEDLHYPSHHVSDIGECDFRISLHLGGLAEWFKATVLKTVEQAIVP